MIYRIFFLITGYGLAIAGGITSIAYLNLIITGYGYIEYLRFISTRIECLLLPIGIVLVWISIYFPNNEKKE